MSSNINTILDEQKFPCIGMSVEERNYCLNIISNCKDICNTENKVDNKSKCEIVKMLFRKDDDIVTFDGFLKLGSENRTIKGELYVEKDRIVVYYEITRIGVEIQNANYSVIDEFKLDNDILKRKSKYSYNERSKYEEIDNKIMKGKLK